MDSDVTNETARSCGSDASDCSRSYFPGMGCTCSAHSESECGCLGVDWTPTEAYRLRTRTMEIYESFKDETAALRRRVDELERAARALVNRWDTPLWKDAPATAEYINRLRALLPENAEPIHGEKNA